MSCFEAYNEKKGEWEVIHISRYEEIINNPDYTSILINENDI